MVERSINIEQATSEAKCTSSNAIISRISAAVSSAVSQVLTYSDPQVQTHTITFRTQIINILNNVNAKHITKRK